VPSSGATATCCSLRFTRSSRATCASTSCSSIPEGEMSGHSKWHSIKHKKGAADAKRGKLFAVLIRQIEIAARSGGGDPASNATLRSMVQKARDNSLPVDTIQRAIKRGTGEEEGVVYEQVSYEGYAASGVAVIVQALTDNRNRTSAEIKNIFSRNGGSFPATSA